MSQPTNNAITNLTRCLRLPGFFPGGYTDQFLRVLQFQEAGGFGRSVQVNRTTSLGDATFYSPTGAIAAAQGDTALTTFTFQRIAGTAQLDTGDIAASAEPNNQLLLQIAMRKVALLRTLSNAVLFGNGVAPNMAGVNFFAAGGGQEIPLGGVAPTLANYHRLVSMVRASDGSLGNGGADALVMNANARRQLLSILEAAGGPFCSFERDPALGYPVMMFEGIPVYVTEGIPVAPQTSIFAVKLRGPTGIRVLHVGGDSTEFGIVVDPVPNQMTVTESAAVVRGYYALMVPEPESVAVMSGALVNAFIP